MPEKSTFSIQDPFLQTVLQDDTILGGEYIRSVPLTTESQVQHFNRQLERYGLTDNAIKVLASNNIQGHISWRILVAREAYIRSLQKYLLPTQYWSGLEQKKLNATQVLQQKINDQKAEELKRFNFNQAYYNQKKAFILDQMALMGYLAFLKSVYISAEILLESKQDRAQFQDFIQAIQQEHVNFVHEHAKNIETIETQIREIDNAIQLCEEELADIRRHKQSLSTEINTQMAVIERLEDQIQDCDSEIEQVDRAIDAQIALQEDLIAQLDGHEHEQQEALQRLDQLLEKKESIQQQKEALEAEIDENDAKQEHHEAECLRLKELLHKATDPDEKAALSDKYWNEFTQMAVREHASMVAHMETESCDEESERCNVEETELKTNVEQIRNSILSIKEKLTTCNQELSRLQERKQAIIARRADLSGKLVIEKQKLQALNQELDKVNEQETLLVENIKLYRELKSHKEAELQDNKEIAALNKEEMDILETLGENTEKLNRANEDITRREANIEKLKRQLESKKEAMQKRERETGLPPSKKTLRQIEKLSTKISDLEDKYLPIEKAKQQKLAQLVKYQNDRKEEIPARIAALAENIARNQHAMQEIQLQIDKREPKRQALQRMTTDRKLLNRTQKNIVPSQQINPPSHLTYADFHPSAPPLSEMEKDPYASLAEHEKPSAPSFFSEKQRDPYAGLAEHEKPSAPSFSSEEQRDPYADLADHEKPSAPSFPSEEERDPYADLADHEKPSAPAPSEPEEEPSNKKKNFTLR